MKIIERPRYSWMGMRIGIWAAVVSALSVFGVVIWLNTFTLAVISALVCFTTVIIAVQSIFFFTIFPRIRQLLVGFEDIISKRFDDDQIKVTAIRDEVDILRLQLSRVSDSIEREIHRLKKIENYRKEFVGDVSHELKTPIFAIQGFIETLLNGALEDEKVNRLFLQKAMKNINRLTMLTQDLMEITKLETGEFKIVRTKFELEPLLKEVLEGLNYKAERESIILRCEDVSPKTMVYADRKQIRQVLNNLVENGIKYNVAEGQVIIKTRVFPKNEHKIEVLVKDTGFGIEPKYLNRLTERFFRIDKSRSREKGGTGLGLSIVKHILEAHGERLSISSQPNNGSTFSFTLDNANSIQD